MRARDRHGLGLTRYVLAVVVDDLWSALMDEVRDIDEGSENVSICFDVAKDFYVSRIVFRFLC